MDWFLYGNGLRYERLKRNVNLVILFSKDEEARVENVFSKTKWEAAIL